MIISAPLTIFWAQTYPRDCQENFPGFVRDLIVASGDVSSIDMPSGDSIQLGGWDGFVRSDRSHPWVPIGISCWEVGTGNDILKKANADYTKRSKLYTDEHLIDKVFIFVTPRRWAKKRSWANEKQSDKIWKEVRAYDADDISQWYQSSNNRQFDSIALRHLKESLRSFLSDKNTQDEFSRTSSWFNDVCSLIEFNNTPSIEGLIGLKPFQAADVKLACDIPSIDASINALKRDKVLLIDGSPGTGKTTQAFLICYKLFTSGYICYFISGASLAKIKLSYPDFSALLNHLNSNHKNCVLLIDDSHLITDFSLREIFELKKFDLHIIHCRTTNRSLSDTIAAGRIEYNYDTQATYSHDTWADLRLKLLEWTNKNSKLLMHSSHTLPFIDYNKLEKSISAWHFFYIIRGGTSSIKKDCDFAHKNDRFDIIYFIVCALVFFRHNSSDYYEILEICRLNSLPHPKMQLSQIETWVKDGLNWLTSNHLAMEHTRGYFPRHYLEAASVMRVLQTSSPDCKLFHELAVKLLSETLNPFELGPHERKAIISGDKSEAKIVIYKLRSFVDKTNIFDLGLIRSSKLESFYSNVWADLVNCINQANFHHLYWIANLVPNLASGAMLYPPTYFISGNPELKFETVSDLIDFTIFSDALVGRKFFRILDCKYLSSKWCSSLLTEVKTLASIKNSLLPTTIDDIVDNLATSFGIIKGNKKEQLLNNKNTRSRNKKKPTLQDIIEAAEHNGPNKFYFEAIRTLDPTKIIDVFLKDSSLSSDLFEQKMLETISITARKELKNDDFDISRSILSSAYKYLTAKRLLAANFCQSLDIEALSLFVNNHYKESPIALFHVWLLSPNIAYRFFDNLSESNREYILRCVSGIDFKSDKFFSIFHCDSSSILFFEFMRWLSKIDSNFKSLYDTLCSKHYTFLLFEKTVNSIPQKKTNQALEADVFLETDSLQH